MKTNLMLSDFVKIPTYENIFISTTGKVYNANTNKYLVVCSGGTYPTVCLNGVNVLLHRLLAMAFKPKPDGYNFDDLQVNHLDGNKQNFDLLNLEWATPSSNCKHAYVTGLRNDNTPILVKDLRDDSIVRFYSLQECARWFKVDGALIHNHLKPRNRGKISKGCFLIIREGEDWPDVNLEDIGKHRNGNAKLLFAYEIATDRTFLFESCGAAGEHLNIASGTIMMHIRRHGEKPRNGWVFRYGEGVEIDKFEIVRLRKTWKRAPRLPVPITVLDINTGVTEDLPSVMVLATRLGVKKSTIQKQMKKYNGIFRNQYQITYRK